MSRRGTKRKYLEEEIDDQDEDFELSPTALAQAVEEAFAVPNSLRSRVGLATALILVSTLTLGVFHLTAADLEGLGEEVRKKVYDSSGITLEWEIMRVGEPAEE